MLSVHLCDMLLLQNTNLDVVTYFCKAKYVASKTTTVFLLIGVDHAHEQKNNCINDVGG